MTGFNSAFKGLNVGRHVYPTAECLEQFVYMVCPEGLQFFVVEPYGCRNNLNQNGIIVALCIHFVISSASFGYYFLEHTVVCKRWC